MMSRRQSKRDQLVHKDFERDFIGLYSLAIRLAILSRIDFHAEVVIPPLFLQLSA